MRFCAHCEVWQRDIECWICGVPCPLDWRIIPARSWCNPATWVAEMETA